MSLYPNKHCVFLSLLLGMSCEGQAADDGARAYQLAPVGTKMLTVHGIATRGNQSAAPGSVIRGSEVDVNVGVLQYTEVVDLAGHATAVFGVLPFGEVEATVELPRQSLSTSSSGLGDAQLGVAFGLIGSPALSVEEYVKYRPGFSLGILGKVFLPTGEYDSNKAVNLGTHRYAWQLGAPMSYALGNSWLDPSLTTFELLPAVIFYSDNHSPYGARRKSQAPLYGGEAHITHNFASPFWMSADMLFWRGGETRTDGENDDNAQRSLSLGVTAGLTLSRNASIKLTYGEAVDRNEDGVEGKLGRVIYSYLF
ncbi:MULTISPECIES: transporter [unclassified Pseudomonas]|uniref:transporter n=1 Tax=unclassified Pseudomonas TaxID=196821 RepID=UPI001593AD0D|nr:MULTISPECIES: transporter [unclassified Pseudomonas]